MKQLCLFKEENTEKSLKDILSESPNFDFTLKLRVLALAPLSMNNSVPGKFYPSGYKPSESMVLGMIENAMGLYIDDKGRKELSKITKKKTSVGKILETSVSKYISVLQHHVNVDIITEPFAMKFTDYFSQQLNRAEGEVRIEGGANVCYSLINNIDYLYKTKEMTDEKKELSKKVACYYTTPSLREYIEPLDDYIITISTSKYLAYVINKSLTNPESPLFLGTNEGWVDVEVVNE